MLRKSGGAVLIGVAGVAAAQTAERPSISPGDRWSFVVYYTVPSRIPNRTWVIETVAPDRLVGTENDEPLTLTRELNVLDSPRVRESNPRLLDFPLEVGKRWQYHTRWLFKQKSSEGTLDMDVRVVGYESIEVPAGTFQAFKLQATGKLGGSSPSSTFFAGQTIATYWYAPAARAIVKSVHHNPYQGTTTTELVDSKSR